MWVLDRSRRHDLFTAVYTFQYAHTCKVFSMATAENQARPRNKRGSGARLHDDIVQAARTLLEQTGRNDAVTLRAVARVAGVTAPSIYAHFADRDEILLAVIERTFAELATALRPTAASPEPPVPALYSVCRAYLDFADQHPHLYRVLFERHHNAPDDTVQGHNDVATMIGADAFEVLLHAVRACIEAGQSTESSAPAATIRAWVALHGMATLHASLPWFPWPPRENLLDEFITRVVDLRSAETMGGGPVLCDR
jgi:AcrR family transcriptional regulator